MKHLKLHSNFIQKLIDFSLLTGVSFSLCLKNAGTWIHGLQNQLQEAILILVKQEPKQEEIFCRFPPPEHRHFL